MADKHHKTRQGKSSALPVLGLDVGGVLVDRVAEDSDTSFFGDRPLETPLVLGALEAVRELATLFDGRIHIVSKAGPKISALTRQWFEARGFLRVGGIPPANVHFVRKRPEKAPVCQELGITHFIDDRVDVLGCLQDVTYRYLFVGGLGPNPAPVESQPGLIRVATWPETLEAIRHTSVASRSRQ